MKLKLLPFAFCLLPFTAAVASDICPFETDAECEIWRTKPMLRETVSPPAAKIPDVQMSAMILAVHANPNMDATNAAAAPFLDRYRSLMKSAESCCADGIASRLETGDTYSGDIYKFLADDANFYTASGGCLMMTNSDIKKTIPNAAKLVADVRNECLCRGRDFFHNLLAPFSDLYDAAPEFAKSRFNYTYLDGMGRPTFVSINTDIKNVMETLKVCPK